MKPLFEHLDMDYGDKTQKKIVDDNIRTVLGMENNTCSEVWVKIKEFGKDDISFWNKVEKALKEQ
jgi:hypothetical protein